MAYIFNVHFISSSHSNPNILVAALLPPPSDHMQTANMWQTIGFPPSHDTDRPSLFSLLVGHDLDIDLLQSTMGAGSERC